MKAFRVLARLLVTVTVLTACGVGTDEVGTEAVGVSDEALTAACPPLPRAAGDRLFTLDHRVPLGADRWIHLRETFTRRALMRHDRRALLMLPGPLVTGEFYQIPVDGYRGRDIVASEGAFAFTADFEGSGESSYPVDGRSPSQASQIEAMRVVVRYIRLIRAVRRVDVLGESWGGGVAAELCADARRVRSCVLASMLYETPSDFANMTFRSPGFHGFLDSLPDGYLDTFPDLYFGLAAPMEPAVSGWMLTEMPGRYTTVPLYDVFDLPFFDPTSSRVPGLLVQGELDPNQSVDDALALVADYGDDMSLVVIEGGGHIPRTEPTPMHDVYWDSVLDFLEL